MSLSDLFRLHHEDPTVAAETSRNPMCEGPSESSSPPAASERTGETAATTHEHANNPQHPPASRPSRPTMHHQGNRRNRRQTPFVDPTAVDLPLSIAKLSSNILSSSSWESQDCQAVTPEFLATLIVNQESFVTPRDEHDPILQDACISNWSTPPLIINKRWIVIGTDHGQVCVWKASTILRQCIAGQGAPPSFSSSTNSIDPVENNAFNGLLPDYAIDCCALLAKTVRDATATNKPPQPRANRNNHHSRQQQQFSSQDAPVTAPIIYLATTAASSSGSDKDATHAHILAAVTDTGLVAVLRLDDETVALVGGFSSGQCSVTCCAVTTTSNADDGMDVNIMIGYQRGQLEAWSLSFPNDATTAGTTKPSRQSSPKCVFRAFLETLCDYEIRSMALLWSSAGRSNTARNELQASPGTPATQSINAESAENTTNYLILVMETASLDQQLPTSAMVEVLDVASLANAWNRNASDLAATAKTDNAPRQTSKPYSEPLEPHFILAEPGMELIDVRARDTARTAESIRPSWIPTTSTNRVVTLDAVSVVPTHKGMAARCLVALSDGTVAVVSAGTTNNGNINRPPSLSWGIARSQDQMLSHYPAIGLGSVSLEREEDSAEDDPLAVFCLGGTTTYMVRLLPQDRSTVNFKATFYPNEIDSDSPVEFLQGFTAGNLLDGWCGSVGEEVSGTKSVAVFIYAWHGGGMLDVYSCQLLEKDRCPRSTLAHLLENGAADMLRLLLVASCSPSNDGNASEGACGRWQRAYDELVLAGSAEEALTLDNLCSNEVCTFRELLLCMAQTK